MVDMPDHPLTFEYVAALTAFAILVGGAIWKIRAQLDDKIEAEADHWRQAMATHQQQHNDFKLEVAQRYASIQHLKDTEDRLVNAINKLEAVITNMPASIAALIKADRRVTRTRS